MKFCEKHLRAYPDDHTGCIFCYTEKKPRKVSKAKAPQPIKPVSEKKKVSDRELSKVRKEKKEKIKYCETCGKTGITLTLSHILSVKQYKKYEKVKENSLLECMDCHTTWEHSSLDEKMKQSTWNRKLAFILANEPQHWNKMQLKSSTIT
jgi:hypothetical protein